MTMLSEDERRIEDWLREEIRDYPRTDYAGYCKMILKAIERGEHKERKP